MITVDKTLVAQALKLDTDEIAQESAFIDQIITSAVSICEGFCNCAFYDSDSESDDDYTLALTDLKTLISKYDTDKESATTDYEKENLYNRFISRRAAIYKRLNGIVVDGTIMAAVVQVIAHLYFNREAVEVSQGVTAVEVPLSARRILEPYLWIGNLAGEAS